MINLPLKEDEEGLGREVQNFVEAFLYFVTIFILKIIF